MGDGAILKLNQNKNIGNKEICAHPADVGESCQNGDVFKMVAAPVSRKRNEKQRMAAKDNSRKIKAIQQKMKPPYGEAEGIGCGCAQGRGQICRVNGTQVLTLSHQVPPHLLYASWPTNRFHSACHTHPSFSGLFFSFSYVSRWCVWILCLYFIPKL